MADRNSVDGFIARRPASQLGGQHKHTPSVAEDETETGLAPHDSQHGLERPASYSDEQATLGSQGLRRSDVDESLAEIDAEERDEEPKKPGRPPRKPLSKKKIIKWAILALILIALGIGGFFVYRVLSTGGSVFRGDIFGLLQQKDLKMDANGRSNVLIIGTSEDDPGHDAAYLTDSIMVLSVDQKAKNAYMMSVPRDLYIKYGQACIPGYAGKINVYFNCVNDDYNSKSAEEERQTKMRELVGSILGMDIQYSAHVNYSVVRDVVNAVGSITVNIEGSQGAPGVMDSNFDWKCKGNTAAEKRASCPPNGHFIEYPNGPATLDAEHALYLAQARGDAIPTYGLGRSNFDRELNQQKIIKAIKEKAVSAGTLTDLGKVNNLISAIGDNLRTNFDSSEIRTLVTLTQDVPNDSIQSISLVDAEPALFTGDGANNIIPTAGTYDYSAIQAYIKKTMNASPLVKENAKVLVLNGSGVVGLAKTEGDKLTALGINVAAPANAPAGTYPKSVIYAIDSNKAKTAEKLSQIYGATPTTDKPPLEVAADIDFVIIVSSPSSVASPTGGTSETTTTE